LGATQLGIAGQLRRKASVVAGVLGTSRSARLASVSPTDPNAEVPVPRYHATTMALSAIETQALRANGSIASSVNGVTLNDVLLAAFHRTLAAHAMPSRGDSISVTVPVTQRQPDERHRFVANLTGQATTTSTSEERKTRLVTMQTMRDQTRRIKREETTDEPAELFSTSILPVRWQARIPKLVSLLTRDRFVATSRLSNLGRQATIRFTSDGFEIAHLWFSPPARMPQGLTAGVIVYDEAIHLSLRACQDLWDRTALLDFANRFVDEIRACSLSNESPHRHADAKQESHESVDPARRDHVEAAVTERSQR